jgi:hypothetical protein
MRTIWYLTLWHKNATSLMYTINGKLARFLTVEEAIKHVGYTNWFVEAHPNGVYLICDPDLNVLWRSDKTYKQLSLFGE